jgi:type I restriction enzyme R subunit
VLTDRNDLDQQLFETCSNCQQLLRQTPMHAANRDSHLYITPTRIDITAWR